MKISLFLGFLPFLNERLQASAISVDSILQIAATAVVTVIGTYGVSWYLGSRKQLGYDVVSNLPLVRREKDVREKLQIMFDGKNVEDVSLVEVRIVNTGNSSIKSEDYEEPLCVVFDTDARILTADVTKVSPDNLKVGVKADGRKVLVDPVLLNSGDCITVKIIGSKLGNQIGIHGRVVDVKEIKKISPDRLPTFMMFSGILVYASGIVIFMISSSIVITLVPMALGLTIMTLALLYRRLLRSSRLT